MKIIQITDHNQPETNLSILDIANATKDSALLRDGKISPLDRTRLQSALSPELPVSNDEKPVVRVVLQSQMNSSK